jgi:hypothetical protein
MHINAIAWAGLNAKPTQRAVDLCLQKRSTSLRLCTEGIGSKIFRRRSYASDAICLVPSV